MFSTSSQTRHVMLSMVLVLALVFSSGCGIFSPDESKDTPPPPGGGDFQPATSPDLLMENFKKAWEQMSIVEYEKLLATDFLFFFDPNDNLDDFVGGPSWDRTKELATATNMFSNQPGFDPVKQVAIPPILKIEFTTFSKINDWADPGTDPLYAGTIRATYKVAITVTLQGSDQLTRVTGDNDFYVEPVQVDGKTLWVIKVWEDRGQDLGT